MARRRRLYLDLPLDQRDHPRRGDVMVGPRTAYRVLDAVPTDSRVWDNRWTLDLESLGPMEDPRRPPMPTAPAGVHWGFVPYRRGEGPTTPGRVGNR